MQFTSNHLTLVGLIVCVCVRVSRGCFGDDVIGGMCVFGHLLIRGCLCKGMEQYKFRCDWYSSAQGKQWLYEYVSKYLMCVCQSKWQ